MKRVLLLNKIQSNLCSMHGFLRYSVMSSHLHQLMISDISEMIVLLENILQHVHSSSKEQIDHAVRRNKVVY